MGHVQDRWTEPGPNGRKVRSARWGRGLRWRARWIEGGRERSQAFPSRDAAEYHLAQLATGTRTARDGLTVEQFCALWLAGQVHYADQTRRTVSARMSRMVLPDLGGVPLADVSRADVQRLVLEWSQRWQPATVRQGYSFLATMFAAAVRDGYVQATPCAAVNLPRQSKPRLVPLTAAQVGEIAGRILPWYRTMVIVGAATGLRGGELRGLTWDRVGASDLLIDRQLVEDEHGRLMFAAPKSAAGSRRITIGRVAAEALAEQAARYPSSEFVWTTRQRGPVDRNAAALAWKAATRGMPLRNRSGWHDLRHHHASVLIAAGESPAAVAERLGHADPAETLRTYAHLWPADHARMAAVADAALAAVTGPPGAVVYLPKRVG